MKFVTGNLWQRLKDWFLASYNLGQPKPLGSVWEDPEWSEFMKDLAEQLESDLKWLKEQKTNERN